MKLPIVLVSFIFISACNNLDNAEKLGLRIGDKVEVVKGFYKLCQGTVTSYDDYDSYPDRVRIVNVVCPNFKNNSTISLNFLDLNAEDVHNLKESQ